MNVKPITKQIAKNVICNKHYSRRLGIFWEGFGLFKNDVLIGVCCFGQPSAPIQKHAFKNRDFRLYELTRLVVDSGHKNAASFLISQSIKLLSNQPCAIVSYADSAHGHSGIVYQATNWIYTGSTISHDKLYVVDGIPTHPITLRDKFKITNPSAWAAKNKIERISPQPKHRYFYFQGDKKNKRKMRQLLVYPEISNYPKSAKLTYDAGEFDCSKYL